MDDLLVNFTVPSAPVPRKVQVTGGSWRERRQKKLQLEGRQKEGSGVNSMELKRSRLEGGEEERREGRREGREGREGRGRERKGDLAERKGDLAERKGDLAGKHPLDGESEGSKRVRFSETNGQFGGKNNSYVSSLFTSNQSSTIEASTSGPALAPSNAPMTISTFSDLVNARLAKHLHETMRFKTPTKVQRAVIPHMLGPEKDLFVKAQTGSGKTLAFLLPVLERMMACDLARDSGLFAAILTPTRELATQIYSVLESLVRCCHHIVPGIVIGGEKKKSEKARLRKGVNILVATPGRLADHIENTSSLDIGQLRWLVLDEGDKLVELGFEETITKITNHISTSSRISETSSRWPALPKKRVNVLCSATIQNNVEKLGSILLKDPEMVSVEKSSDMTAPDQLVQSVVVVPPKLRLVTLAALLKRKQNRTIVFFSCSDSVDFHFDVFTRKENEKNGNENEKKQNEENENEKNDNEKNENENNESKKQNESNASNAPQIDQKVSDHSMCGSAPLISSTVYKLHGSLTQAARTATLQAFINDKSAHSVLFCTDVASRGLDMPDISSVIEYDPPFTVDDHLHRIGRSARVGKEGSATLFLLPGSEEGYVDGKLRVVHSNLRIVAYGDILKDGFAKIEADVKKNKDPKAKYGKWDVHATTWHLDVERWLLEDSAAHSKAVQGFTSHVRAYATHLSTERAFFNVKLLHLGHLAKSFGLRETPKKLGGNVGREKKKEDPKKKMLRMARLAVKQAEFNY